MKKFLLCLVLLCVPFISGAGEGNSIYCEYDNRDSDGAHIVFKLEKTSNGLHAAVHAQQWFDRLHGGNQIRKEFFNKLECAFDSVDHALFICTDIDQKPNEPLNVLLSSTRITTLNRSGQKESLIRVDLFRKGEQHSKQIDFHEKYCKAQ